MRVALLLVAIVGIAIGVGGTLGIEALTDNDERSACEFLTTGVESESSPATPPTDDQEVRDAQVRQEFLEVLAYKACTGSFPPTEEPA